MAAVIKRLHVQRFRGIQELIWRPTGGLNLLLGGGNVGKTTLLEAIGLLLSPTTNYMLSDADYYGRRIEDEFQIEAVMALPGEINRQHGMAWPWEWNGQEATLPQMAAPDENVGQEPAVSAVYKVRVRGTQDLELIHEVVQPDDNVVGFSVGLRREIGLVRLLGDDRHDRDLRMVQGSNLDRLINDRGLRARLGHELAVNSVDQHLDEASRARLLLLNQQFASYRLPGQLGLAFTGGGGQSINALIGLTAEKEGVALPVASWGAGTRRLAALAIGDALQNGHPITLIDELERGLEPYRQRQLIRQIAEGPGQTFITTHSSSVVSAAAATTIWYVSTGGQVSEIPTNRVERHVARQPEAFLARLSVVAEGATEVGFLEELLEGALPGWRDFGVFVTDGGGNDDALILLEALSRAGVKLGGFVDNENRNLERWRAVRERADGLVFQWQEGCLEENVIPMFATEQVAELIVDPAGLKTARRLRTLADRLGTADVNLDALTDQARMQNNPEDVQWNHPLTPWIVAAATGKVPEALRDAGPDRRNPYKGHASDWFKSIDGGHELFGKVRDMGVWDQGLRGLLTPFIEAVVRAQAGPAIAERRPEGL